MSQLLLQYETIDAPQINAVMEGRDPPPPMGWDKSPSNKDGGNNNDKGGDARPVAPIAGPAEQI
jgi:cell division protease FtsH